jgi:mono/diheme cytochrome c family protein
MRSSTAVLLLLFAAPALAQDPAPGRVLYETHCGGCHYERVHERARSDVKGLADLRDTVARWTEQTKHRFTLDEIENVVQYLNESHYRFGLPPDLQRRGR